MRIHVLLEDLRHEEILPSSRKFWTKGLRLGLRKEQFIAEKKMSSAKHTLNILRLLNYCKQNLKDVHNVSEQPCAPGSSPAALPFLQSRWSKSRLADDTGGGLIFRHMNQRAINNLLRFATHAFYDR